MTFWNNLFGWMQDMGSAANDFDTNSTSVFDDSSEISPINPATGLPMIGTDFSGVDVGGSPFGVDIHD